jgi:hypothetical protein
MSRLPAVRSFLPLAVFLVGAVILLSSIPCVQAQQGPAEGAEQGSGGVPNGYYEPRRPSRGIGFYSLTLSDIWGPAKMPPAPKDFGPHFDFPPEPLNGAPLHDPYPN